MPRWEGYSRRYDWDVIWICDRLEVWWPANIVVTHTLEDRIFAQDIHERFQSEMRQKWAEPPGGLIVLKGRAVLIGRHAFGTALAAYVREHQLRIVKKWPDWIGVQWREKRDE